MDACRPNFRFRLTGEGAPPIGTITINTITFDGDSNRITVVFDDPVDGSALAGAWLTNTTLAEDVGSWDSEVDPVTQKFNVSPLWLPGTEWLTNANAFPVAPGQTGSIT